LARPRDRAGAKAHLLSAFSAPFDYAQGRLKVVPFHEVRL
jgi:hypothetical protein